MNKYRVTHYYTTSEIYEVEAESASAALDLVNSGKVKPDLITGSEFSDEMIEGIE